MHMYMYMYIYIYRFLYFVFRVIQLIYYINLQQSDRKHTQALQMTAIMTTPHLLL